MPKHGTKSSQKAEMTPEEFVIKWRSTWPDLSKQNASGSYELKNDGKYLLSDLRSVIRGELIRYVEAHSDDDCYFLKEDVELIVDNYLRDNPIV